MSQFLDWKVQDDLANIREGAIDLRAKNAETLFLPIFQTSEGGARFLKTGRTLWRRRVLEKAEKVIGHPIRGKLIEVGAGTGWCSAWLSQKDTVSEIYTLDYDHYCVEKLMPAVFKSLGAKSDKITRVAGSYNNMKCPDEEFDFVVSIGAINHSENLPATFRECNRVLKKGGYMIATEPCEFNSLSLSEQQEIANSFEDDKSVIKKYGPDVGPVKKRDNSDHLYRLFEYEAYALTAGFDVNSFVFDASPSSGGLFSLFGRILKGALFGDLCFSRPEPYRGFSRNVLYPFFSKGAYFYPGLLYDRLMLVLRKP